MSSTIEAVDKPKDVENVISFEKYGLTYTETFSKRALKKLKKREHFEARKQDLKKVEKEKKKAKKQEALEALAAVPEEERSLLKNFGVKLTTMTNSTCKQRIAIDLSFVDGKHMKFLEMNKCKKQVQHCYSQNRRVANPSQFYLTSVSGLCEELLAKVSGYKNWDVNICKESYLDTFDRDQTVYLTSDSENVLQSLDDSKVYIIGGLVDHNSHKGLCHKLAKGHGIDTARLPIEEYLDMKTRKVLTVNHVFQILILVSNGFSWLDALLKAIPARKEAKAKITTDINAEDISDSTTNDQCLNKKISTSSD